MVALEEEPSKRKISERERERERENVQKRIVRDLRFESAASKVADKPYERIELAAKLLRKLPLVALQNRRISHALRLPCRMETVKKKIKKSVLKREKKKLVSSRSVLLLLLYYIQSSFIVNAKYNGG